MTSRMIRRRLRAVAAVMVLLMCAGSAVAQVAKERKNIDNLTPQELAAYKHAIDVLQKSTDPNNNYVYHANLHNLFLTTPPHGCEHGNDLFFPWHRYHLANFEKALQAADPDNPTLSTKNVTIPYWNWTRPASGTRYPSDFENALDAGGQRNPLYDDFRNQAAAAPIYDEAYMTGIVRNNADWNLFAGGPKDVNEFYGAFESPAHNTMHGTYIGGDMGDPSSAAMDPIYWSFHAFIDFQWDRWQKIHNKPPTSLDKVLRGFINAPTTSATVTVDGLGYFYTHSPESIAPMAMVESQQPLNPRVSRLASAIPGAERMVAVWGGPGPFVFKVNSPRNFRRADLWFDDILIPSTTSYRAEVFICPADQAPQPTDSAGYLTIWKGHTSLGGATHRKHGKMFLNITDALRKTSAANPGKELKATIVITPIPLGVRPKASAKPVVPALEDEVQFKGVRLVLDDDGKISTATNQGVRHGH